MGEIELSITKMEREIEILKRQKLGIDSEINKLSKKSLTIENKINGFQELINSLKPRNIRISTHALLRYVERILGINLDEIKKKILTKEIEENYYRLGNGKYHNGSFTLLINNDTVVTITTRE